jgi:hypothetical protein
MHFGINDGSISHLGCQIPEGYRIRLGPSERAAVPLLDKDLLDLRETVGPQFCALLHEGYKVEIEAVVSAMGTPAPIFQLAETTQFMPGR